MILGIIKADFSGMDDKVAGLISLSCFLWFLILSIPTGMLMNRIDIWQDGEYKYPLAFEFKPNLRSYLLDDGQTHPCMMVLPGGGYGPM